MDLAPGDVITLGTRRAVFVTRSPHPLYSGLLLVIWRLLEGVDQLDDEWSFDALRPDQEVGELVDEPFTVRHDRLAAIFETA
jgi:hypothetical protein